MESVRKFLIMIASFNRANFLLSRTYGLLKKHNTKARIVILCSDDDKSLGEYKKIYGEENLFIFNKDKYESKLKIDLGDSFYKASNIKKGIVWARNIQFEVARKLGYRYFLFLDDDYDSFTLRCRVIDFNSNKAILSTKQRIVTDKFDEVCEHYFRILDSQDFMYSVAFCQKGDLIGGLNNKLYKMGYKFKAMNAFFCDTEKEFRYLGRINEDVNAYVTYNNKGQIFMTLFDVCLNQPTTQMTSGGMTDVYKQFGTWLKSIYSVMFAPYAVTINTMGNTRETFRIHHNVEYKNCVPKILSDKYCKGQCLNYKKEVIKEVVKLDENGYVIENKKYDFLDEKVKEIILNDVNLNEDVNLNDLF